MYNLVFWQNIPSPHQMPVLRSLASMGHNVTLIVDQLELAERKSMGWSMPDCDGVKLFQSSDIDIRKIIANQENDTVNISSGIRGCASGLAVVQECINQRRRLGFIAEPGDPRGLRGLLRRLIYRKDALKYQRNIDFILAMGQTGIDWYLASGYPENMVFPYCYVVDDIQTDNQEIEAGQFRICYVGSLVQLKRVDLLLRAVASMDTPNFVLTIVGDGNEKKRLLQLSKKLGIEDRIEWIGYQPHPVALQHINSSDLLVLPSEYDGWGAVVNEALMQGVPVVCSDTCGASDLLGDQELGLVFESGNSKSLSAAILTAIDRGKLNTDMHKYIMDWSACISDHSVAAYFTQILDHIYSGSKKPSAPWRMQ